MSRGALSSYSFLATISSGSSSVVISLRALSSIRVPPTAGYLRRVRCKSVASALTGTNYDITLWATDSTTAINRAAFEVYRETGIAPNGGSASARVDLNAPMDASYRMQGNEGVFTHDDDLQIEIDTGSAEASDRQFRVVLEIEGAQTPGSPTLSNTIYSENNGF